MFKVHSWSQRWTVLLHSVMSTAFGAKQPSYSVIISLDRKIRDFPIPALWRPVCDDADIPAPTVPLELNMHRWLCMSRKEMSTADSFAGSFLYCVLQGPDCSDFESSPTILHPGSKGHANGFSKAPIYTLCDSHL